MIPVGVEKRDSLKVTQKSAYWVMPPGIQTVSYAPIKDTDFIGKKRKASKFSNNDGDNLSSNKKRQYHYAF